MHIAWWAYMHRFLSIRLSIRHWIIIHISESIKGTSLSQNISAKKPLIIVRQHDQGPSTYIFQVQDSLARVGGQIWAIAVTGRAHYNVKLHFLFTFSVL